jgi:hypothetical protein
MTNGAQLSPRAIYLLIVPLVACAPSLSNEARFLDASVCPTSMQDQFFSQRCAMEGCHVQYEAQGGLDFVSPDLASRLVDVEATTCAGRRLIDSEDPEASFLLERLEPDPMCGDEAVLRMPADGNHLDADEMACVRAWVFALAGGRDDAP